jgi:hypothetical protein
MGCPSDAFVQRDHAGAAKSQVVLKRETRALYLTLFGIAT